MSRKGHGVVRPSWRGALCFYNMYHSTATTYQARPYSYRERLPYTKADRLLTQTEESFFETLSQVANKMNLLLFAKVRMEDLVRVPVYTVNRCGWRNRVKSCHVDFVLCNRETTRPLLGIELDDWTHEQPLKIEKDQMVNQIFKDASLSLLRVEVDPYNKIDRYYRFRWLENEIRSYIGNVL